MATVTAIKAGNWEDPTVWDTGAVPGLLDIADCASYIVNVYHREVEAAEFRNNGGYFNVRYPDSILRGDVYGISGSRCVYAYEGGTVIGDFYGTSAYAVAVVHNGIAVGNSYGDVQPGINCSSNGVFIGNAYGSETNSNVYGANLYRALMRGKGFGGSMGHGVIVNIATFIGEAESSVANRGVVIAAGGLGLIVDGGTVDNGSYPVSTSSNAMYKFETAADAVGSYIHAASFEATDDQLAMLDFPPAAAGGGGVQGFPASRLAA